MMIERKIQNCFDTHRNWHIYNIIYTLENVICMSSIFCTNSGDSRSFGKQKWMFQLLGGYQLNIQVAFLLQLAYVGHNTYIQMS